MINKTTVYYESFLLELRQLIPLGIFYLKVYHQHILHEFRHYWQREKYPIVFYWWLKDHIQLYEDYQEARDEKGTRLSYLYCPLEKDADAFEKSGGVEGKEVELINPIMDESYWREILKEKTVYKSAF